MAKGKKKRTITGKDVGKVFRLHCPSVWTSFFWVSNGYPPSISNGDLLLVHSRSVFGTSFYLYMLRRKKKWILGTIAREDRYMAGCWFEELSPLEVLILLGANLPRKYKRKHLMVANG